MSDTERIAELEAKLEAARGEIARLRNANRRQVSKERREIREILELGDAEDDGYLHVHAPEDALIGSLCEQIGYGAVMDAAARLWRRRNPTGAKTVGPCVCTVLRALELCRPGPRKPTQ